MSHPTWIGLLAALLTTTAFLPQVLKIWRTRSAEDISFATFATFTTGVGLWLLYGWFASDVPLMAANAVTLLLSGAILAMKVGFSRRLPRLDRRA